MDLKYKEFYQKHKERYKGNEETLKELILHQAKEEMFLTFSKEELIFLLKKLIKEYVHFFLNNDLGNFKNVLEEIEDVIIFFDYEFPNIYYYFNYLLLLEFNQRLNKLYSDPDNELSVFKPVFIDEIKGNENKIITLKELDEILSVSNEPDEETKKFLDKIGYDYE